MVLGLGYIACRDCTVRKAPLFMHIVSKVWGGGSTEMVCHPVIVEELESVK